MKKTQFKLFWILTTFALFILPQISAQEYMRINLSDGTVINIPIAEIQKLTFDITIGIQQQTKVAKQLLKLKAYPNPARNFVNLDYCLLENGPVLLEIFNIAGNRLLSKELGTQKPGEYQYRWHTSGWPTGTYICRIQQNKEVVTEKLIINK